MTPEFINLLGQLPVVGIFIAFVLMTRSDDRKERQARDESVREERTTRDNEWRDFIKGQNDALSAALNKLCTNLDEHDTKTQASLDLIKERQLQKTQPYTRKS